MRLQLLSLALLLGAIVAGAREIQVSVPFKQFGQHEGWFYLGKIVLRVGTSDIKISTERIQGEGRNHGGQIWLGLVPEDLWSNQTDNRCKNPTEGIRLAHELLLQGSISISEHSVHITKEELYYLVLRDCQHKFQTDYKNQQLLIDIKIQILNSGGYMGEEEDHWLSLPIIIVIGLWMIMSDKYFLRAQFQHDPDYAKMILFGAVGTNISSLMWRSFGYLIYLFKGSNYLLFHIIYLFMHAISETMVLALLVLVSMGWSLNYLNGPRFDLAVPLISLLALINIALALMTQLSNSSHDMHHTFDAPAGWGLIVVRLIVGLGFLVSIFVTYQESRFRVREFLKKFGLLGFLYICSMPLVVLVANWMVPARQRNQFVFIMVEGIKSVCNISLVYMISSSRSEYNKLCYKNTSFMPSETSLF